MDIQIRDFQPGDAARWDDYVERHPLATCFHLSAWKSTIEEAFRFRPHYLLAEQDGAIRGLLPLFYVRNWITGKVLISTPFAVYGGILADSPEVQQALYQKARDLAFSLDVQHLELRNAHPGQCVGLPRVDRYVTFVHPLGPEVDILAAADKKTRNMVRKALKFPYSIRRGVTDLSRFKELYSRNLRRLGTPSFPYRFFDLLQRNFGGAVQVNEISLDNRVVAASFSFLFRGDMHTYYAASDFDVWDKAPNNYMYYEHLGWAGANGFSTFDFGRSKKDTGTYEFKRHWGTVMRELPYEILLVRRKQMPNFSPANKNFDLAIRIWQRLPLPVTRLLGPRLLRLFP